jgi:Uri superfamily endonuclease
LNSRLVLHGDVLLTRPLPRIKGTYAVLFYCATKVVSLPRGCAGKYTLRPGWYVYIGSAFGPGGVCARVSRHLSKGAPVRWQIDRTKRYLTPHAVWFTVDAKKRECLWARSVLKMPKASYLSRVGSSDCDCPAHFVVFDKCPTIRTFKSIIVRSCPQHDGIWSSKVVA